MKWVSRKGKAWGELLGMGLMGRQKAKEKVEKRDEEKEMLKVLWKVSLMVCGLEMSKGTSRG
jgi:hypothetical protein